jgi:hypothetical protein
MSRMTQLNRCARWTALVALVLATLAPTLAHALRHARGEVLPWSQVCNATGSTRLITAFGEDGAPADPRMQAFEQCAYCALHHDGSAPPSSQPGSIDFESSTLSQPAGLWSAPRWPLTWSDAQPRAPPSLD